MNRQMENTLRDCADIYGWADISVDNIFEHDPNNFTKATLLEETEYCSKCNGYGVIVSGKSKFQCTECENSSGLKLKGD